MSQPPTKPAATERVAPLPAPPAAAHVPHLRRHVQPVHHEQRRWLWLAGALVAMAMLGAAVAVAVLRVGDDARTRAPARPPTAAAPSAPAERAEPGAPPTRRCPSYGQKHLDGEGPGPHPVDDCSSP